MSPPGAAAVRSLIQTIPVPTPFPVGPVNVHLIKADPITLVDVGPLTDEAWAALVYGLKREGLGLGDVKRVLLTHGHHDHYGMAGRLADRGARLLGGRHDAKHFERRFNRRYLLDQLARSGFEVGVRFVVSVGVAAVDRYSEPLAAWDPLDGGEVLQGNGYSVLVRSAPGHTPGSLTFEVPEAGVLFTGDTVLKDITPNAVVEEDPERPGELFRSVSRYLETLDAILGVNGDATLYTGHGRPILDYREHHRMVSGKYRRRATRILHELSGGPRNVAELVAAIFPRVRRINLYLAYSELTGFLMSLEDRGQVERVVSRREDRYRLVA